MHKPSLRVLWCGPGGIEWSPPVLKTPQRCKTLGYKRAHFRPHFVWNPGAIVCLLISKFVSGVHPMGKSKGNPCEDIAAILHRKQIQLEPEKYDINFNHNSATTGHTWFAPPSATHSILIESCPMATSAACCNASKLTTSVRESEMVLRVLGHVATSAAWFLAHSE
jgi:hypothetical protein